ncbi:TPA: MFS transporter [Enterobacter hormaechei]|nr:MFS transporter [Enterobacter hormaechei]
MMGLMLHFMGHFSIFTYFRPFLETFTEASVNELSFMLLLLGAAGLIGNYYIGILLKNRLLTWLITILVAMVLVSVLLMALGHSLLMTGALLAFWGLIATPAGVVWWFWLSRVMPDRAELGGGLMVAFIQLAITVGAGLGGEMFDAVGWWAPFVSGAVLLILSATFAALSARMERHNPTVATVEQ